MSIQLPIPLDGVCGYLLAHELRAAGIPVPDPDEPGSVSVFVTVGSVYINAPDEHAAACTTVLKAHKKPRDLRPRSEAAILADILAAMPEMNTPTGKLTARLLARQARKDDGVLADLGLSIPTTEPVP